MSIENGSMENKAELPKVERITASDLRLETPELGGTVIVLQRNAKDNRDPNSELEMGALVPGAAEQVKIHTKESLDRVFQTLNPEERKNVDILIVAADTKLETPMPMVKSDHKRAVETAEQVISGVKECLQKFSLPETQLLNKSGKPIELSSGRLNDLHMFEDSPEFVQFLVNKYGTEEKFWEAYENDTERETREIMGTEGPDDIAERVRDYLRVLANAMKSYHESHPGRRVIVWAESHYDAISPFVKRHVTKMEGADYLLVDNAAGIVINLDKDQKATTQIQGSRYDLSFSSSEAK